MKNRNNEPVAARVSTPPSSAERRRFLALGLKVTGVLAGGSLLALVPAPKAEAAAQDGLLQRMGIVGNFPYKPHYAMALHVDLCIDCERCIEACGRTNNVPAYGYRISVLDRGEQQLKGREFLPVLCNHCNHPPCVRVCPTRATFKDKVNGIVQTDYQRCIGCRACMTACPYNARYYNEELRSVDKCDFCFRSRLNNGKDTPACVEACPARVMVFGDLADRDSEVSRLVREAGKEVWALRPQTGAVPNVFYVRDPQAAAGA